MVNDSGEQIQIGSQEDIGEFMLFFLTRLDEGLKLQLKPSHPSLMQS